MSDYSSDLKDVGSTGSPWPDNYYHIEGEAPVDAWENNFKHNIHQDVQHLVGLTNSRIESAYGTATSKPSDPEDGEQYWNTDDNQLEVYHASSQSWKVVGLDGDLEAHKSDTNNPHGVTFSQVGAIEDASGTVSESHLDFDPATQAELDTHAGKTDNPHSVDVSQLDTYSTSDADSNFAASGHDHDSRYYTQSSVESNFVSTSGDSMDGDLDVGGLLTEQTNRVATRTWVNSGVQTDVDDHKNNTDNPHGVDVSQLDTYSTSESDSNFAASGHDHDSRYYTQSAADSNFNNYTDSEARSAINGTNPQFGSYIGFNNDNSVIEHDDGNGGRSGSDQIIFKGDGSASSSELVAGYVKLSGELTENASI